MCYNGICFLFSILIIQNVYSCKSLFNDCCKFKNCCKTPNPCDGQDFISAFLGINDSDYILSVEDVKISKDDFKVDEVYVNKISPEYDNITQKGVKVVLLIKEELSSTANGKVVNEFYVSFYFIKASAKVEYNKRFATKVNDLSLKSVFQDALTYKVIIKEMSSETDKFVAYMLNDEFFKLFADSIKKGTNIYNVLTDCAVYECKKSKN